MFKSIVIGRGELNLLLLIVKSETFCWKESGLACIEENLNGKDVIS
jgi:hypothetical protein